MQFYEMKLSFAVVSMLKEFKPLVNSVAHEVVDVLLRILSFTFADAHKIAVLN